ncbi:IS5 family transposase [Streptomyces sp. WAC 06783]|uniref:IS5 family transposase n=1 Tax=Streptomyces sp. WAC 06783 TaxID=2203211 RepID=UPI0037DD6ADF
MGWGDLTDAEWARLEPHLPRNVGRGRRWKSHRRVVNGILFRLRTGIPWRDLPTWFGNWKTVYERRRRWSADGTWEHMLRTVLAEGRIDWSMVSVDSTVCRAHQHAAGARRKAPRKPRTRIRPAQHRPAGGRPRTCPDHLSGDKAYSSRRNRRRTSPLAPPVTRRALTGRCGAGSRRRSPAPAAAPRRAKADSTPSGRLLRSPCGREETHRRGC